MKSQQSHTNMAISGVAVITLLSVLLSVVLSSALNVSRGDTQPKEKDHMQLVDGIGGVFIFSEDPAKLAKWYQDNLGIVSIENKEDNNFYCEFVYRQLAKPDQKSRTVWAILPAKEKRAAGARQFQINYRVDDLDTVIKHLKANQVTIEKVEDYDYGRFAWVEDCDGNRIELFQEKTAL